LPPPAADADTGPIDGGGEDSNDPNSLESQARVIGVAGNRMYTYALLLADETGKPTTVVNPASMDPQRPRIDVFA
jgi:hypothetical protein